MQVKKLQKKLVVEKRLQTFKYERVSNEYNLLLFGLPLKQLEWQLDTRNKNTFLRISMLNKESFPFF